MREILKNKRIVIMSILAIVVIIILVLNQTNIVETITNTIKNVMLAQQENVETNAYYEIISQNEDDLEILITIENPNGIEKIVSGDTEYKCKGKQTVTFDRKMKEGEEQEYKITPVDGKEESYRILASTKLKLNLLKHEKEEDVVNSLVQVTYEDNSKVENYYSMDDGESWNIYKEPFEVKIDSGDEYLQKKIIIKSEYKEGKTIQKIPETFSMISNRMGLINDVGFYINETKNYELKQIDETYNVHAYVIEGDKEIDTDTTYGDKEDIGKNMIVVKVNGNLTINEGKTITAIRK